jgi:ketosteroid isomerase-like protein
VVLWPVVFLVVNPLCFVDDSMLFLGHEYRPSTPDGALFQVILEVRDMSRQVAFYRDTLGLRVTYPKGATDFSDQTFVRFATPGASLVLHTQTGRDRPAAPARLSFMAHDIVGRRKELLERKVDLGPIRQPAPGVLITDGRDPEGNVIHIETRVAASSANDETETGVKEALDAWVRAYNAGEWDVFLAFYADDPRFHLHEKGRTLYTSKEEVARAIRGSYASVAEASFTADQPRVLAASDRVALVTTEYEHRLAFRDGTPLVLKGTMHLFMERSSDGWQILAGDTITRE